MQSTGYDGNLQVQSVEALQTIQNLFIYGVSILGVIMIVIMIFYKLDKEYPQIMRELLEREAKQMQKNEK